VASVSDLPDFDVVLLERAAAHRAGLRDGQFVAVHRRRLVRAVACRRASTRSARHVGQLTGLFVQTALTRPLRGNRIHDTTVTLTGCTWSLAHTAMPFTMIGSFMAA
jgi:hypothetical protein